MRPHTILTPSVRSTIAADGTKLTPVYEVPTGTIGGGNTRFKLTYAPADSWLVLMLDNALESPVSDFSLVGNVITYAQAPQSGDIHEAWYFRGAGDSPVGPLSSPVTVASAAGAGKLLYVPGGSSLPSGWQNVGFDDSAWPAPVLQTAFSAGAATAGSQWIADTASPRGSGYTRPLYNLLRQHFTLPVADYASCSIAMQEDDTAQVWLNGTLVASGSGGSIDPTLLVPGDNLIAAEITDTLPTYIVFCFVLTVN
jgi:hypothetical protein